MKVKIFEKKSSKHIFSKKPPSQEQLQTEINNWLEENKQIEIKDIKQSCCGGSLEPGITIVSIWYETN